MNDRRSQDMSYDDLGYDHAVIVYHGCNGWLEQYVVTFPDEQKAAEYLYLSRGRIIVYYGNVPEFPTDVDLIDFAEVHAVHADDQAYWCKRSFWSDSASCQATLRYGSVITEVILAADSKEDYTVANFSSLVSAADQNMEPIWNPDAHTLLPLPTTIPQPLWQWVD